MKPGIPITLSLSASVALSVALAVLMFFLHQLPVATSTLAPETGLDQGLVGHWTFDAGDVAFSNAGGRIRDHAFPLHDLNAQDSSRDRLEFDLHGAAVRFDDASTSTDYLRIVDRQDNTRNLGKGDLSGTAWIWLNTLRDEEIFPQLHPQ